MKLYMHPVSQTSRPIRLLIAEKGLNVEEEVVDLMTGAHHQEPFISVNPSRQVPVVEDGDLRMTECSAILEYLADKYDMPEYPKDLKKRARVNEIMDWSNTGFYRDWRLQSRLGLQYGLSANLSASQEAKRGWPEGRCRMGARQGRILAAGA